MNLIRKGHRNTHRGVIGIESAIVLIAFVIVAAALAFVVLNMGFATTQKAKTSITSALGEAGSSLSISGKVIGDSSGNDPLEAIMIPIKLTSGGESVDLNTTRATVSYLSNSISYDNIYRNGCTLTTTTYDNATEAWAAAALIPTCADSNPITAGAPTNTVAIIYWSVAQGTAPYNTILEPGEHAVLSVAWSAGPPEERPSGLDQIAIELGVTGGATLTTERTIPNISSVVVDLG